VLTLDPAVVAALVGLGPASVTTIFQGFSSFRRSNVDKFFEQLLQTKEDLTVFGKHDDLQRYLFSILEKVSHEANQEKIESWKNATIRLATDFNKFDYKDNFIRTLDFLTAFDLTVLVAIYSFEFKNENIEKELLEVLERKSVPREMTMQSIKALAAQNLLSDNFDRTAVYGTEDKPILRETHYTKNSLGPSFLRFITDKTIILE
jgi:hypothetical protein